MPMNGRLLRPRQTIHPESADWANRVRTNGGSVSGTTLKAVDRFVKAIHAAGIRDRFYRLNLFCGNSDGNLNAVRTPLYRGPSLIGTQYGNTTDTNSNFVAGDYVETGAQGGLQSDGGTKYLNTGLNVFNAGLAADDFHCGSYFNSALNNSGIFLGTRNAVTGATKGVQFFPAFATSGMFVRFGGLVNSGIEAGALAANNGMLVGVRRPTGVGFRNGLNINAPSNISGAQVWLTSTDTPDLFVFNTNSSNGAGVSWFFGRAQMYSVGKGLSDAQALAYYDATQAFQTALTRGT